VAAGHVEAKPNTFFFGGCEFIVDAVIAVEAFSNVTAFAVTPDP
jgi:hypothetical protein